MARTQRSFAVAPVVGDHPAVRWLPLVLVLVLGCGRSRGSTALGQPCRSDFDCEVGYCASAMGAPLVCSPTCREDSECPEGWSCHGVTRSGIVVCAQGSGIPIPH